MVVLSQHSLPTSARRLRWGILGLTVAPIVGAQLYNRGYGLPWTCPILHFTGIPCPTCGMTRSFMAMARADWGQAVAYHGFGVILFGSFIVASLHVAVELLSHRQISTPYTRLVVDRRFQVGALLSLLMYHGYRLMLLSQSGALQQGVLHSPIGQIIFWVK